VIASGARLLGLGLALACVTRAPLWADVFTKLGEIASTLWPRPPDMRWMDGAAERMKDGGRCVAGG
jgi:hypothetical protein